MRKWLKELVHNAVVHPLMMVLPENLATELHDRNADWAFGAERYDEVALEKGERQCPICHRPIQAEEGVSVVPVELQQAIVRSRCIVRGEVVVDARLLCSLLANSGIRVVDASDPLGWGIEHVPAAEPN